MSIAFENVTAARIKIAKGVYYRMGSVNVQQRGGDTHLHLEIGGREVERYIINTVNGQAKRVY